MAGLWTSSPHLMAPSGPSSSTMPRAVSPWCVSKTLAAMLALRLPLSPTLWATMATMALAGLSPGLPVAVMVAAVLRKALTAAQAAGSSNQAVRVLRVAVLTGELAVVASRQEEDHLHHPHQARRESVKCKAKSVK